MSTVTKLGAYGLAVAAALAVALAVLVTAPRSSVDAQTATDNVPAPDVVIEAYTETGGGPDDGDDSNDIAAFGAPSATPEKRAGDSLYIQVTDLGPNDGDDDPPEAGSVATLFRFSLDSSSSATGTFKSGGGTSLACRDGRSCDLDSDSDDIIVQFDIADDVANNSDLVISVVNVNENKTVRVVAEVNAKLSASEFTVELVANSSTTRPASGTSGTFDDEAQFRVELWDNQKPREMYAGAKIEITITRGVFRSAGLDPSCAAVGVTQCTAGMDDNGGWVQVRGNGTPGTSTLTLTAGGFTVTKELTFYGDAKKITAEAEQGSIEVGGSVFIVVTVVDGAGNPIAGVEPDAASTGDDDIQGPAGVNNPVRVTATNTVAKDVAGTKDDLPACNDGTNAKGKCVIQVTAPDGGDTPANDATRGTHTVTVTTTETSIAAADRKQKVAIQVAGPVGKVSTDAPERVDFGSTTPIVVTVVDDEGVRAGAQSVSVTKISGPGVLRNGGPAVTKDGQHTFTYRAASGAASAEFEVEIRATSAAGEATDTGKVLASTSFIIAVGDEPAPPAPEEPTATGISSDAPERVEPGSSTDITVTVTDADGEPAGRQSVTATQVSGDGRIINGGPAATEDGEYTFTFRAAGTTGTAEIDVDVRALDEDGAATTTGRVIDTVSITIQVGEPEPEMATLTPAPSGSLMNTAFSGGSVSDLQAVLLSECSSASVTAYTTVGGNWVPFIPGSRIAAVNAAFIAAVASDGMVPAGTLLTVSGCD